MQIMTVQKRENRGVEEREDQILFLVSILTGEEKREFADQFKGAFEELVESGILKRSTTYAYYSLGKTPSDEKVALVAEYEPKALRWIIRKVKEKCIVAGEIIKELEKEVEEE